MDGDAHMIRDLRRMQKNRLGVLSQTEGEANDLHPGISSIKADTDHQKRSGIAIEVVSLLLLIVDTIVDSADSSIDRSDRWIAIISVNLVQD